MQLALYISLKYISMTQSIFYSILFFDSDHEHSEHNHFDKNVTFCNSEKHLADILSLYGEIKVAVCICCKNKRPILDKLLQCSNVASILVCTKHNSDLTQQDLLANRCAIIKQNSFENSRQWQIEAHR